MVQKAESALYTFYPCDAAGNSSTFLTYELHDDAEARRRAVTVALQHSTCSYVAVWCGSRNVGTTVQRSADPA